MKCANAFTKGHLNVCPAKDITGKKCNYRGRFAEPSKSRNKRPPVKFVNDNLVNNIGRTNIPPENFWSDFQETCVVINARNENGQSDDGNFSVLSIRISYDENGQETKKLLNIRMG